MGDSSHRICPVHQRQITPYMLECPRCRDERELAKMRAKEETRRRLGKVGDEAKTAEAVQAFNDHSAMVREAAGC